MPRKAYSRSLDADGGKLTPRSGESRYEKTLSGAVNRRTEELEEAKKAARP